MTARQDTRDYRALFLADAPMMDMRAPAEFARGAFPSAHSLPLMTDEERAEVGVCYKRHGQDAAIALGYRLVAGEQRENRLQGWLDFAHRHPDGYLYCFRGGLRSQTVQQWLRDAGIDYPLVQGGYKAMRRFLIDELERSLEAAELVLVSGRTGVGKTRVIEAIPRAIDLEGLARHRGSAFGLLLEPQPSQIGFENAVSIALLKQLADGQRRVFLEDEGRLIGRLALPDGLRERMVDAPMLVVEDSLEGRVQTVLEDYILDLGLRFQRAFGEQGPQRHRDRLQGDLLKIRKRLGGALQQELSAVMDRAFEAQAASGSPELHRQWIRALLADYYDPMYDYQFSRRSGRRLFAGPREAVIAWAREQQG
jgi:tRNA 2-selenouridine synthase